MKVVSFTWDNGKGCEWAGQHLIIGQMLDQRINEEASHVHIYGISLDIADVSKDFQLRNLSCSTSLLSSEVKPITKEQARALYIAELDKALDLIFNEDEQKAVNNFYNKPGDEPDQNEDQ